MVSAANEPGPRRKRVTTLPRPLFRPSRRRLPQHRRRFFGRALEEEAGTGIAFRHCERDLFRPFGVP
jgi:hypothetical protein